MICDVPISTMLLHLRRQDTDRAEVEKRAVSSPGSYLTLDGIIGRMLMILVRKSRRMSVVAVKENTAIAGFQHFEPEYMHVIEAGDDERVAYQFLRAPPWVLLQ